MTNLTQRGGKRDGAGRPSSGKARVNLTLNKDLVAKARAKEGNLSALIDSLLAQHLGEKY